MSELFLNYHDNSRGDDTSSKELYIFGQPGERVQIKNLNGFSRSVELNQKGFSIVKIPIEQAMIGTGTNQLGFQIKAEGDVTAYFSNRSPLTTDLTVILEKASLGKEYVLASNGFENRESGQFSVQATEDSTVVEVALPDGQAFSRTLQAGETFKFATGVNSNSLGISIPASFDLTGTRVTTSAPAAVFSGHLCTNLGEGRCDHLLEQMPPIKSLSSSYVVGSASSDRGSGNNLIRVIAPSANTQVKINGKVVASIGAQDHYEFVLTDAAAVVETSKPTLIAQYLQGNTTAGEGDPAMMFVPGRKSWLSSYRLATPAGAAQFDSNLVNIIIPTSAISTLKLEGQAVDSSRFTRIAGTGLSVGNVDVPIGLFSLTADRAFQVSLFGYEDFDSYLTFGAATFARGISPINPTEPNLTLSGTDSRDILSGKGGSDRIKALAGNDLVEGKGGNDTIFGQAGNDRLNGGDGDDRLLGGDGSDTIRGGAGNDILKGEAGSDRLFGDDGNDRLIAGSGLNRLYGGKGDDALIGGEDDDSLFGESGDDRIVAKAGNDILTGGDGNDRLLGGEGNDTIVAGDGDDRLIGGSGADMLRGDRDNDRLIGGDGNDILSGGKGDDTLIGGEQNDILLGDAGNDRLNGGSDNDQLLGGAGDDILIGGKGNDRLAGGAGNDILVGGSGRDIFVLSGSAGTDIVRDFDLRADRIALEGISLGQITLNRDRNTVSIEKNNRILAVIQGITELKANSFV